MTIDNRPEASACWSSLRKITRLCFCLMVGMTLIGTSIDAHAQGIDNFIRILPLGNSITQGNPDDYGPSYRERLWEKLSDSLGYNIDFVGSMSKHSNGDLDLADDPAHEGHSGWRADDIYNGCERPWGSCASNSGTDKLADWLASYTPDIVLLHIGTNDITWHDQDVASTVYDIEEIIRQLRIDNPDVVVLLAKIVPYTKEPYEDENGYHRGGDLVDDLNAEIDDIAQDQDQPNSPVVVVDHYTDFDAANWLADGVHPNAAGEEFMANQWLDALQDPFLDGWPFVALQGGAGWRMLAAPSNSLTIGDLADQNLIQGVDGSHQDAQQNIYAEYDGGGWANPSDISTSTVLESGRGFIWYFFDNNIATSKALPFRLFANNDEPSSDVFVGLHTAGNKWNLLGNPFARPIDVSNIDNWANGTLTSNVVQTWDPVAASYVDVDVVDAWQGFFVENDNATGITIPYANRLEESSGFYGKGAVAAALERELDFELVGRDTQGTVVTQDKVISLFFGETSELEWDTWDASKLTPLTAPYATLAFVGERDGRVVLKAQEALPFPLEDRIELPMMLRTYGFDGELTITWPYWENIPEDWQVTLTDQEQNMTVDLRQQDSYTFVHRAPAGKQKAAVSSFALPQAQALAMAATDVSPRFLLTINMGRLVAADNPGELPEAAQLSQNYPNPFRDATQFTLLLPKAQPVRVEVFDLLGRQVAVVHDGMLEAGRTHTFTFHAPADLPSGTYLYRISGEHFTETLRMVYVK